MQQASRGDSGNSSAVHPLKSNEDENLDYDSNASSSSFEFHRGERMAHRSLTRSLSRPTSYKWNDAEKWIMNKQAVQASYSNKNHGVPGMNVVRVAPEAAGYEYRPPIRVPDTKKVDFCQSTAQMDSERFNSAHPGPELALARSNAGNVQIDLYPQNKDLSQGGNAKNFPDDVAGSCLFTYSQLELFIFGAYYQLECLYCLSITDSDTFGFLLSIALQLQSNPSKSICC